MEKQTNVDGVGAVKSKNVNYLPIDYQLNTISIKISARFFVDINKIILKFI